MDTNKVIPGAKLKIRKQKVEIRNEKYESARRLLLGGKK